MTEIRLTEEQVGAWQRVVSALDALCDSMPQIEREAEKKAKLLVDKKRLTNRMSPS